VITAMLKKNVRKPGNRRMDGRGRGENQVRRGSRRIVVVGNLRRCRESRDSSRKGEENLPTQRRRTMEVSREKGADVRGSEEK